MSSQLRADECPGAVGVLGDADTIVMRRVYLAARRLFGERFVIGEEIERRLAIIVLFTYSAERPASTDLMDEGELVALCIDRLMAQTAHGANRPDP